MRSVLGLRPLRHLKASRLPWSSPDLQAEGESRLHQELHEVFAPASSLPFLGCPLRPLVSCLLGAAVALSAPHRKKAEGRLGRRKFGKIPLDCLVDFSSLGLCGQASAS